MLMRDYFDALEHRDPAAREAALMAAQCLKEKVYPPDIARMALWLAADDSRLVTAQNFVVDGGRM